MSDLVSKLIGMVVLWNKVVVGDNVFVYELGIYQDGFLKEKFIYEIILLEFVGVIVDVFVLGKYFGCYVFKDWLIVLGF